MKISDCMKRNVISIDASATVRQAVALCIQHHIGTLPVVDPDRRVIGLITLQDLLYLVMPDFVRVVEHFEFVHGFGLLEIRQPSQTDLGRSVTEIMGQRVCVDENAGLLYTAAQLHGTGLIDMPVVDVDGRLIGIASHVDIGLALMGNWQTG